MMIYGSYCLFGEIYLMNAIVPINQALQATDNQRASQNPAVVYLSHFLSKRSGRVMRNALRNIVLIITDLAPQDLELDAELNFAWHELRYQHTQAIYAKLINAYKPATVNRHLSALRGVLKECWRLGYMDAETYKRAVDFQNAKYTVLPAGRDVPEKELRKLLIGCYEDGNKGIRDLAILAVLATTGIRREELAQLDHADFDAETGSLRILGKGHKERIVYVANKTEDCLNDWLKLRGSWNGPLFVSINKGGKLSAKRFPASAIHTMLTDRAKNAGIKKITPHDLRRTFIGNMLDKNVDSVTVTKITGHADPKMLLRYDRRAEKTKRDAISKLDLPI